MSEQWKEIPGYEGRYEVSNFGRVHSVLRTVTKQNQFGVDCSQTYGGKELAQADRGPYKLTILCKDGKGTNRYIHQLVCEAFHGPRPTPKHQVNHKNGDTNDNRAENLEWMTPLENIRHSINVLGNAKCGEASGQAKLTEADVRRIRDLLASGMSVSEAARQFNLGKTTVANVYYRRTWKHVA